jgi:ParB family chromosome partitioning protein
MPKPHPFQANRQKVFQGVPAVDTFPQPNLSRSLDDILNSQDEDEAALPAKTESRSEPSSVTPAKADLDLQEVPVDLIDGPPFQPRLALSDEEQAQLTTAIAIAGRVNRPLLLRRMPNGRYQRLGGSSRFASVLALGWPTVPARIVDVDDDEAELLTVSDNEGQTGLSDFEKGRAYDRLLKRGKISSARALADRLRTSPATVSRCLAFMKLPPDCINYLVENPSILGIKHIAEFVELGQNHPDLCYEALVKIDQECKSQEAALRWANAQVALQTGKVSESVRHVSTINLGKGDATVTRNRSSISLKLPKGVDVDAVEQAVIKALSSISQS